MARARSERRAARARRQSRTVASTAQDRGHLLRWGPLLLGVLFLIALAWRLAYISRLEDAALIGSVRADERVYWDWATYLLNNGFQGTNPFFFGPLYPYVLAAVRALVGSEFSAVLMAQAVWGSVAAVLVADAARRIVGWPIGLAAGLLYALYQMNVFFDGLILMESLVLFLEALLIWLWTRSAERGAGLGASAAIGAVTGLIALGRGTGAVLLLPAWWIIKRREGEGLPPMFARAGVMLATFALAVMPATIHNWKVSGEFIPLTYNFGINLYIGNHADATGRYAWVIGPQGVDRVEGLRPDGGIESDGREFLEHTEGLTLSPRESSSLWSSRAVRWASENPLEVLRLAGAKILLLWNMREQHQLESAEMFDRRAGPLGLPLLGTFIVVGLLGLVGFAQAGAYARIGPALRVYIVAFTVAMLPFFVTDRYRIHMVPALIVLAAIAVHAWQTRSTRRASLRGFVVPALLALALALVPLTHPSGLLYEMIAGIDMGGRWLDRGRPDLALVEFEKSIAADERIQGVEDVIDHNARAALFYNYAHALRATGRGNEALPWFERAAEVAPENPRFLRTLGDAYLVAGRKREGDSLLTAAGELMGSSGELLLSRGYAAAREGRLAEAESLFVEAVDAGMRNYGAWGALVRIQVQQGAVDRARETMKQMHQTSAPVNFLRLYDALVAAAAGENARAQALLDQVPAALTADDPILARVRSATEKMIAGEN